MGTRRGRSKILRFAALVMLATVLFAACDIGGSPEEQAAATLDAALADHVAGRTEDARSKYQEVLESEPNNHLALYNLGLLAQTEGDTSAAEDFYRRALAVTPDFEPALFNLAIVRAQEGDSDEAIELYRRVIAVNPESAGAHLNLGFLHLELGQEARGNAEIQRAIEIDPLLAERVAPPQGSTGEPTPEPEATE
jgi:tetratricopeptide (TPR) repeat protein